METPLGPVDLIPNTWRSTPTACLEWWLKNPLVEHFFPGLPAKRLAQLPTMPLPKQRDTMIALRVARAKARASRPRPEAVSEVTWEDLLREFDRIEDKPERDDMLAFGRTLHPMEYEWFAAQLRSSLAARGVAPAASAQAA